MKHYSLKAAQPTLVEDEDGTLCGRVEVEEHFSELVFCNRSLRSSVAERDQKIAELTKERDKLRELLNNATGDGDKPKTMTWEEALSELANGHEVRRSRWTRGIALVNSAAGGGIRVVAQGCSTKPWDALPEDFWATDWVKVTKC